MKTKKVDLSLKLRDACFYFDELRRVLSRGLLKVIEDLCEEGIHRFWNGITVYYSNGEYYVDNPHEDEVVEVETLKDLQEVLKEYKVI